MNLFQKLKTVYQKSKRGLIYLDLIFVVIVFYAGKYLGPLRDQLLPAAIAGAFAILLESLFSINDLLQKNQESIAYLNINMAFPKILEILKQGSNKKHTIKIIASSGGTTVNSTIPQLLREVIVPLEISVLVINPKSRFMEYLPKHWALESSATLNRLEQLKTIKDSPHTITCHTYDYIPCVRGFLIDEKHLFIGFFHWMKAGDGVELKGADNPHSYYKRTPEHENYFALFESWFTLAPKRIVLRSITNKRTKLVNA